VDIYIETPRMLLRGWEDEDIAGFIKMNADAEVMRYFPQPYDEARTVRLHDAIQCEFAEYGYGLYVAEEKAGGSFMGFIGFHHTDIEADFCPCTEIGWRLDKHFWNKGYATEGASACLKYGFERLGFDKVYSFTAVENTPSRRVMQKAGMRFEKYFDHPGLAKGHPLRTHICFSAEKHTYIFR